MSAPYRRALGRATHAQDGPTGRMRSTGGATSGQHPDRGVSELLRGLPGMEAGREEKKARKGLTPLPGYAAGVGAAGGDQGVPSYTS